MVKINLRSLDRDIFIQGDDSLPRTIQIGQTNTVGDVVIVDAANWSVDSDGNASVDGTFNAGGNAVIGGTMEVTGAATFTSNITMVSGCTSPTNSSGSSNEAFGNGALASITNGSNNTAIGKDALSSLTTGLSNVGIGFNAGYSLESGSANTLIGREAGENLSAASASSTAIGYRAMHNTTNDGMTAIGANAMANSNGDNNLAIGTNALLGSGATEHTGQFNIAIGANALSSVEGGVSWNNTAIGGDALRLLTTGGGNTAVGKDCGENITTGGSNVLIGLACGTDLVGGSSNILIGGQIEPDSASSTGELKIHYFGGSLTPLISGDMVNGHAGVNTMIANQGATLHVTTDSGDGLPTLELQQDSTAEPFIEFDATSAASTANPVTSYTSGNSIQGFVRVSINGVDRWMPFYDAPTS